MILTQRRRSHGSNKQRKRMAILFLLSPPPLGRGLGVAPRALACNTAGNPQAGGDGGQDGRYGLNDEFPSILLHVSFFLRLIHFSFRGRRKEEGGRRKLLRYRPFIQDRTTGA